VSASTFLSQRIEEVIAGHPGVLEWRLIGVEGDNRSVKPSAFVVQKDPTSPTAAAIIINCGTQLTHTRVPNRSSCQGPACDTNVGKILRRDCAM